MKERKEFRLNYRYNTLWTCGEEGCCSDGGYDGKLYRIREEGEPELLFEWESEWNYCVYGEDELIKIAENEVRELIGCASNFDVSDILEINNEY